MPAVTNLTGEQPVYQSIRTLSGQYILQIDQPLLDAIDISEYNILDIELGALSLTLGQYGGAVAFGLLTSMQNQTEDGWIGADYWSDSRYRLGYFAANVSEPTYQISSFGPRGLLRYVRFSVTYGGAPDSTAKVLFLIRGMARRVGAR